MKRFILSLIALTFLSCSAEAASCFWVGGSGTWDQTNTGGGGTGGIKWASASGGGSACTATSGPAAGVPGPSDTVSFDANSGGGTATVAATFNSTNTISAISTMAGYTGTLDFSVNNPNISMASISCSGTGAKTLKMGSGTFTMTQANGTLVDLGGGSCTVNAGTSTLLLSATAASSRFISLGNNTTLYNVTVSNPSYNTYTIDLSNGGTPITVNNLTFTNVGIVTLGNGISWTINGTLTYDGQSATQPSILNSRGTAFTLSVAGANTLNNLVIQNLTKAGAGSITCNNCYSGGGNTSVTINNPATGGGGIIGG